MPDFKIERRCTGLVCGVDEAGRGPLAGPVVAAAVVLDPRRFPKSLRDGLDNSKVLSIEEREACYGALRRCVARGTAHIGVGAASVAEIDRINILRAALLAMARAVAVLGVRPDIALVDGNIAPPVALRRADRRQRRCSQLLDRRRFRHRQGHPRSHHARPCAALSGLWMEHQCRLRDTGAWRGDSPIRRDPRITGGPLRRSAWRSPAMRYCRCSPSRSRVRRRPTHC